MNLRMPQLKSCYHLEWVESDGVFLLTEDAYQHRLLRNRVYAALVPLLDGAHGTDDIIASLTPRFNAPEVLYALAQLQAQGLVVEGDDDTPVSELAYWQLLGADSSTLRQRLQTATVSLSEAGGADSTSLRDALIQLGVRVTRVPGDGALDIVVTDDYLQPDLKRINDRALHNGRPWMLVKLLGAIAWIGPLFVPGQTGCWRCLAQRLEDNRQVESYILRKKAQADPLPTSRAQLPTVIGAAAHLAATEVLKWIVRGENADITGRVVTYDALNAQMQSHVLVRRPQCTACGDPKVIHALRQPKPVQLRPSAKRFTAEAGHRSAAPEETFSHFKHHISPITGVVNSLVSRANESNGLTFSYSAGHNFAMLRDDMSILRRNMRGQSGGKGMSDIQARVSAIGEAIERYSGVYRGDEPVVRGSYTQLADKAIHLHDCLLFSEAQYVARHAWNRHRTSNFHIVPNPFNESLEIDWAPCWSLTNQAFKYVPTAYCYFGHPDVLDHFYCGSDANGCASGNTLEEAVLQGFLELVERDAIAVWWYNRVNRPGVDVRSFKLPYFDQLEAYYASLQRSLWVLDLTGDLGIPVFAAVSGRTDRPVEDILIGFGAHLDPRIALMRALSEINQALPTVVNRNSDGSTRYWVTDDETLDWFKRATFATQPYLVPDAATGLRTAPNFARLDSDDIAKDVQFCVDTAAKAGLETLVLDQTRPDVGMPVCRVIVPGLRHFWRRLGPGRLYSVPVKLGWLDQPKTEDELNPFSIYF